MLVDSCVWIDFFNGHDNPQVEILRQGLRGDEIIIGDLVRLEVLRGYRNARMATRVGDLLDIYSMARLSDATRIEAALRLDRAMQDIGRRMSTVDLLIASWCATEQVPLLTRDVAFGWAASVSSLRLVAAELR
jgi:predicted nucleic acid-binding protein